HLQHFLELGAQVGQLEGGALRPSAVEGGYQCSEPRAVDIAHVGQVQHDLFLARCEQALYFFAEGVAFLAQHDAPLDIHHGHAIHVSFRHSQCHVHASWKTLYLFLNCVLELAVSAQAADLPISKNPSRTYSSRKTSRSTCNSAAPAAPNTAGNNRKHTPFSARPRAQRVLSQLVGPAVQARPDVPSVGVLRTHFYSTSRP